MLVGAHADAATQMADDEVHVLVPFTQLRGGLAAHRLVVQGVELTQPPELGKAGVVGHLGHLVHADRVHEEGGDAHHVPQLAGQIRAQVGGVLAVGRGLHIGHDLVIDGVGAGGDGAVQPAAAADRGKIGQLVSSIADGLENGRLAIVRLVDDPGEPVQLLGRVVDGDLEQLLLVLKHRDLGGGSAGIYDQKLHSFSPSVRIRKIIRQAFHRMLRYPYCIMAPPCRDVNGLSRIFSNLAFRTKNHRERC